MNLAMSGYVAWSPALANAVESAWDRITEDGNQVAA